MRTSIATASRAVTRNAVARSLVDILNPLADAGWAEVTTHVHERRGRGAPSGGTAKGSTDTTPPPVGLGHPREQLRDSAGICHVLVPALPQVAGATVPLCRWTAVVTTPWDCVTSTA